jgi:hypothetical protein
MNKEYQEATNEYLKVCVAAFFLLFGELRSGGGEEGGEWEWMGRGGGWERKEDS